MLDTFPVIKACTAYRVNGVETRDFPFSIIITIALFVVIYVVLLVAWARICAKFIKQGPTLPHDADELLSKGGDPR